MLLREESILRKFQTERLLVHTSQKEIDMSYFDYEPSFFLDDTEMYEEEEDFIDADGYGKDGHFYGMPEYKRYKEFDDD